MDRGGRPQANAQANDTGLGLHRSDEQRVRRWGGLGYLRGDVSPEA